MGHRVNPENSAMKSVYNVGGFIRAAVDIKGIACGISELGFLNVWEFAW